MSFYLRSQALLREALEAPILFLDIDGVLNSSVYLARFPEAAKDRSLKHGTNMRMWFDPAAVAILNLVTDTTGAQLVVSSNWVLSHAPWDLVKLFKQVGIKGKVRDCTNPMYAERTDRIDDWLRTHRPSVWAVVDDDRSVLKYFPDVVLTNPRVGLTHDDAVTLISLLGPGGTP